MRKILAVVFILMSLAGKSQKLDTVIITNFQLQAKDIELFTPYLLTSTNDDHFEMFIRFRKNYQTFSNPTNQQLITCDTTNAKAIYDFWILLQNINIASLSNAYSRLDAAIRLIVSPNLQTAVTNRDAELQAAMLEIRKFGKKRLTGKF